MKKLFAIVLCLAMCFGVLAMSASAEGGYYVAGYPGLCNGKEWDPGAAENAMSDPDGDGIYSITYTNVAAGSYQFKVTDGTWTNCWPGSNYELTLDSTCDVTIHFNSATLEITVDAAGQGAVEAPTFETISIIGSGIEALGEWNTDIAMTEISEGIYELTLSNVPAGSWPNLKFRANNAWDHDFGCADGNVGAVSGTATEAVYKGANIWFEVAEESNVTLRLDLTAFDYSTKSGASFTVTITPVSAEPSTPSEPVTPEEPVVPDDTNPKDGDSIALVFALLAVSAAGIAVVAKKKEF